MTVSVDGSPVGTANVIQKLQPDGGKTVELRITRGAIEVRQTSRYDRLGRAIRLTQETRRDGRVIGQRIADVSARGAWWVQDDRGTRTRTEIALPPEVKQENPAEFWFLRDRPAVGAKVYAFTFSVSAGDWRRTDSEYTGPVTLPGGTVAHRVVTARGDSRAETFFTDRGEIVRMVTNGIVLAKP